MVLECNPEAKNPHDPFAVLVKCPPLWTFPRHLWDVQTRGPPESSSPRQNVEMVAGKLIGRVPKEIRQIFSMGLKGGMRRWMLRAVAIHIGGFVHDGPVTGGGPKLKCVYMLYIKKSSPVSVPFICNFLRPHIDTSRLFC